MQIESIIPKTYEQWRHCIEVICKQAFSSDYVRERLDEMGKPQHFKTRQFAELYGDAHRQQVISWFEQAAKEMASAR